MDIIEARVAPTQRSPTKTRQSPARQNQRIASSASQPALLCGQCRPSPLASIANQAIGQAGGQNTTQAEETGVLVA